MHLTCVKGGEPTDKALCVDGSQLFQKDDGAAVQARSILHHDVRRQLRLPFACHRCDDGGGAVAVADVVLEDEHGARAALLASEHGVEVGEEHVSAMDGRLHGLFLSAGM